MVKPVIAKMPGDVWLTLPLDGEGVPLVQETDTVTEAELPSEKFLLTVSVAQLQRVLVIVQEGEPPFAIATLAQLPDSA
jgi:hypothetical protein